MAFKDISNDTYFVIFFLVYKHNIVNAISTSPFSDKYIGTSDATISKHHEIGTSEFEVRVQFQNIMKYKRSNGQVANIHFSNCLYVYQICF